MIDNHRQVLELLGHPTRIDILPATVVCPVCNKETLVIQLDEEQTWMFCRSCSISGNVIEIAAASWQMDLATAASRLAISNILDHQRVQNHLLGQAQQRQNFKKLLCFEKSKEILLGPGRRLLAFLETKGIEAQRSGFLAGPGRFLMACSQEEVPGLCFHRDEDYLLLLPWLDRPGRLSGLTVVSEMGKEKILGKSLGITFYKQLQDSEFGSTNFALIDNPWQCLLLHDLEDRYGSKQLPLVSISSKTQSLEGLDTSLILWAPEITSEVIALAKRTNSKISKQPAKIQSTPYSALVKAYKQAEKWLEVFSQFAINSTDNILTNLLSACGINWTNYREIRSELSVMAQLRIDTFFAASSRRRLEFANHIYEERNNCWYCDGKLFSEHVIRIDKIIFSGTNTYYEGRIFCGNVTVPFCEPVLKAEKLIVKWLRSLILNAKQVPGLLPRSGAPVGLIDLAMRFWPPLVVNNSIRNIPGDGGFTAQTEFKL